MKKFRFLSGCSFFLFLVIAMLVLSGLLSGAETVVCNTLTAWRPQAAVSIARALSLLCNPPTVVAFCLVSLLIPRLRRTIAPPLILSASLSAVIGQIVKRIIARPRPVLEHLVHANGYSFPSGHSLTSAAVCLTLALILPAWMPPGRTRKLLQILLSLLPLFIGLSRIYLGVHYAGDVLGGWLLGCATAFALSDIWLRRRSSCQTQ